eukprot:4673302-Amphidinium_carterae.5
MDNDLSRSCTRQFHESERRDSASGCPVPMSTHTYDMYTPRDDALMRFSAHILKSIVATTC